MATGDLEGNIDRLKAEVRRTKYAGHLDMAGLRLGDPGAFVPLLQHTLLHFSRHVSQDLIAHGLELRGKTDMRFVEIALKVMREHYGLKPVLTAAQFLDKGFAERKVMLVRDLICHCVKLHNEAVRMHRVAHVPSAKGSEITVRQQPRIEEQAHDIVCNGTQAQRQPREQLGATRNFFSPRDNPSVVLVTPRCAATSTASLNQQPSSSHAASEAACDHERDDSLDANRDTLAWPAGTLSEPAQSHAQGGDRHPGSRPITGDVTARFAHWPKISPELATVQSQPSGNPFANSSDAADVPAERVGGGSAIPAINGGREGMAGLSHEPISDRQGGAAASQSPAAVLRRISSMKDGVVRGDVREQEAARKLQLNGQLQGLLHGLEQQGLGADAVQEIAEAVQQIQVKHAKQSHQKGGAEISLLQKVEQLEAKQAAAEVELAAVKREALQTQQQLQARVVVLEGRLRNFEGAAYGRQPAIVPSYQRPTTGPPSHALLQGAQWSMHSHPGFPGRPAFPTQRLERDSAAWQFQAGKENSSVGRDIMKTRGFKVPEANGQNEEEEARATGVEDTERLVQEVRARYEQAHSLLQPGS